MYVAIHLHLTQSAGYYKHYSSAFIIIDNNNFKLQYINTMLIINNCIGGIMVSVLTSSLVDRGFEPMPGQTMDYRICISPLSTEASRRKDKD